MNNVVPLGVHEPAEEDRWSFYASQAHDELIIAAAAFATAALVTGSPRATDAEDLAVLVDLVLPAGLRALSAVREWQKEMVES